MHYYNLIRKYKCFSFGFFVKYLDNSEVVRLPRKFYTKKDLVILSYLRSNARMSLTDMSRETHIPVSTIFDRLKAFSRGMIKKHTSIVDFQQLGFNTRAVLTLKTSKEHREDMKDVLMTHPHVNSLHRINNGMDYLIEVLFHDLKELENFIESLEEKFVIEMVHVYYIIDDLKREAFISTPDHVDLVSRGQKLQDAP